MMRSVLEKSGDLKGVCFVVKLEIFGISLRVFL